MVNHFYRVNVSTTFEFDVHRLNSRGVEKPNPQILKRDIQNSFCIKAESRFEAIDEAKRRQERWLASLSQKEILERMYAWSLHEPDFILRPNKFRLDERMRKASATCYELCADEVIKNFSVNEIAEAMADCSELRHTRG